MSVRHAIKGFETHMHDTAAQARHCTELGGPEVFFAELDAIAEAAGNAGEYHAGR